jgi:hypothetical protein
MALEKMVYTTAGNALIAKADAGNCRLLFTHGELGSGTWTDADEAAKATSLKASKISKTVDSAVVLDDSSISVRTVFDNLNLTEGFRVTEGAIFAAEDDGSGGIKSGTEVLCVLAYCTSDHGDYFIPYDDTHVNTITLEPTITTSAASSARCIMDMSIYASQQSVQEYAQKVQGYHAVKQITFPSSGTWSAATINGTSCVVNAQTVTAIHIDPPSYRPIYAAVFPTDDEVKAWANIYGITADAETNTIRCYCYSQPSTDITAEFEGVE